jgi:cell division initiation protein
LDFRQTKRGYDPQQVDEYVETLRAGYVELTGEYEALAAEKERLEEAAKAQPDPADIAGALIEAQNTARQVTDMARLRAEELVRDAELEAGRLVDEARREASRILLTKDAIERQLRDLMRTLDRDRGS